MKQSEDRFKNSDRNHLLLTIAKLEAQVEALTLQLQLRPPEAEGIVVSQTIKDVFLCRGGIGVSKLAAAMLLSDSSAGNKMSGYSSTTAFDLYLVEKAYPNMVNWSETIMELGRIRHLRMMKERHPRAVGKTRADFFHPNSNVPQ